MTANEAIHYFGVRHHGPGSARSLLRALEELRPDCILIEGPPDADELIPLAAEEGMEPPLALLVYAADAPQRAAFYPFAVFSPEWQAIRYAVANFVPVRFMDLPQWHQLSPAPAEAAAPDANAANDEGENADDNDNAGENEIDMQAENSTIRAQARLDPISLLAQAAGDDDGERWWEHVVEHRAADAGIFPAIADAMQTLRETIEKESAQAEAPKALLREARREAYMRQAIRAEQKNGRERIAVVCGAWHVPALRANVTAKADQSALKGLPKIKTAAAWTPWTYGRMTQASGYGAGVQSPGWYEHLWHCAEKKLDNQSTTIAWLVRVAHAFRDEDFDLSSAHVIEMTRLAETMAQLAGRTRPGLAELNDAVRTVACMGESAPLALLHRKLYVGEKLGRVSENVPVPPLIADLDRQQKKLRLPPAALERMLDLDLRKEGDLARSCLLHRLDLLRVPWGRLQGTSGRARGTFHEIWRLQWHPEFAVALTEAAIWGNTIESAAERLSIDVARKADQMAAIAALMDRVLLAGLDQAIPPVLARLEECSTISADVSQMMDSLPQLVNAMRYGSVRQANLESIGRILRGLIVRVCIGLSAACQSMDDEAAQAMLVRFNETHSAIQRLNEEDEKGAWLGALGALASRDDLHAMLVGRACRILMEEGIAPREEIETRLARRTSPGTDPLVAAAWMEGFLSGSGAFLIHDQDLWSMIDDWICTIHSDRFVNTLPILRRAFSGYTAHERRELGERAKASAVPGGGPKKARRSDPVEGFDLRRAERILPVLMRTLGLPAPSKTPKESLRP